ncbi:hypothetical protein Agub_g13082, partial [Astrephomene gubernaculifera]
MFSTNVDVCTSLQRISSALDQTSISEFRNARLGRRRPLSSQQVQPPRLQPGEAIYDSPSYLQLPSAIVPLHNGTTNALTVCAQSALGGKDSVEQSTPAIQAVVELRIVPRAAALIAELFQVTGTCNGPGDEEGTSAAAPCTSPSSASSSAPGPHQIPPAGPAGSAAQLMHVTRYVLLALELMHVMTTCATLGFEMYASEAATNVRSTITSHRAQLYEQLCDVTLGRAMAAAVRFVQLEVWPLFAAPGAAVGGPQQAPPSGASGQRPSSSGCSLGSKERAATQLKLCQGACGAILSGAQLISHLDSLHRRLPTSGASGSNASPALTCSPQQQRLQQLACMLQHSGLLAAVCGAVLTAPPRVQLKPTGGPRNAGKGLNDAIITTIAVLRTLVGRNVLGSIRGGDDKEALLDALAAPEVVRLQRGLLERVVADAGGSSDSTHSWTHLNGIRQLGRAINEMMPNERDALRPECMHALFAELAFKPWVEIGESPQLRPSVPSPPERVRLALRLLRVLYGLACGRGVKEQYDMASAGARPGRLLCSVASILEALVAMPPGSYEEPSNVGMVVEAQKACAWALEIVNMVEQRGWPRDGAGMGQLRVMPDCILAQMKLLAEIELPADTLRSLALHLGQARLLRSFDARLRCTARVTLAATAPAATAAAGGGGGGRGPVVAAAAAPTGSIDLSTSAPVAHAPFTSMLWSMHVTLRPLMAEMLLNTWEQQLGVAEGKGGSGSSGSRGVGQGLPSKAEGAGGRSQQHQQANDAACEPWVTKRELGFFITVSKLALREAVELECRRWEPAAAPPAVPGAPARAAGQTMPLPPYTQTCSHPVARELAVQLHFALNPERGLLAVWKRASPHLQDSAAGLTEALRLVTRAACVLAAPLLLQLVKDVPGKRESMEEV